jgi:sulfatase maturation enzyme AslB (radical SAM superfamily)
MSLADWFNSPPVRDFRMEMFSNNGTTTCSRCYKETKLSGTSRRHRSNQKSVIFTKTAFDLSYKQSPGFSHFAFSQEMGGITNTLPIDLHIDLGNHCNLACKMCWPGASTRIASQYVKWNIAGSEQYLGVDWTKDSATWQRFLNELAVIPKLKNLHLMGGETLLSPRFEELVDFMTAHDRYDVSFSFVTNGTVYRPELIEKLSKFARVGIEISIETATRHNDYIRQGSNVEEVLANIQRYKQLCSQPNMSLTIRPAISLLSAGYYHTLLRYCLANDLLIKSLIVTEPSYLDAKALPQAVREAYLKEYQAIRDELADIDITVDYNESDVNKVKHSVKQQAEQVINLLNFIQVMGYESQLESAVHWMSRWDKEFGFDARELYPEFITALEMYGY